MSNPAITKFLMKFPKIKKAFAVMKGAFENHDAKKNSEIKDSERLAHLLKGLGITGTPEEFHKWFEESDLDHSKVIEFREILIAAGLHFQTVTEAEAKKTKHLRKMTTKKKKKS
eukprot:UN32295